MPDYSRPHFADPFLGDFGSERIGTLASDLPPATDGEIIDHTPSPNALIMRIIAIVVVAAVVYFILKKLSEKNADVPKLEE